MPCDGPVQSGHLDHVGRQSAGAYDLVRPYEVDERCQHQHAALSSLPGKGLQHLAVVVGLWKSPLDWPQFEKGSNRLYEPSTH